MSRFAPQLLHAAPNKVAPAGACSSGPSQPLLGRDKQGRVWPPSHCLLSCATGALPTEQPKCKKRGRGKSFQKWLRKGELVFSRFRHDQKRSGIDSDRWSRQDEGRPLAQLLRKRFGFALCLFTRLDRAARVRKLIVAGVAKKAAALFLETAQHLRRKCPCQRRARCMRCLGEIVVTSRAPRGQHRRSLGGRDCQLANEFL